MSRLHAGKRTSTAVIWEAVGTDDYGEVKVAAPCEILVRWEESEQSPVNPASSTASIAATIVLDQPYPLLSIMWLGNLSDFPDPPVDLFQIQSVDRIPNIKGRAFRRVANLIRYKNTLPTIES